MSHDQKVVLLREDVDISVWFDLTLVGWVRPTSLKQRVPGQQQWSTLQNVRLAYLDLLEKIPNGKELHFTTDAFGMEMKEVKETPPPAPPREPGFWGRLGEWFRGS